MGEVKEVGTFRIVELQGSGERVEYRCRHPTDRAAFQLGVVLHTDPCQRRDLTAAQARHPPGPGHRQAGLAAQITEQFVAAAAIGDLEGLLSMLAPDTTWTADFGDKAAHSHVTGALEDPESTAAQRDGENAVSAW